MADVLGSGGARKVPVPLLTPRLSSLWIGLVTPVDAGVARPLIESLASETVVTDPEPALFDRRRCPGRPEARDDRPPQAVHAVRPVELRATTASLALAEEFGIARARAPTQSVVQVELEHEGVVGRGEASPVYYRGETVESAREFLTTAAPPLVGDDPFALEEIEERLEDVEGEAAGKAALDAALHDWIGRRLGVPLWRLLGLSPTAPPTSYTIGIDTVEGTRDRARRARDFRALKVKVGGAGGPRARRGRARGVGRAAPGGRQRGLDARDGARADARADPARRRVRGAAVPRRGHRLLHRPQGAAPAPAGDRRRGLPGPERRRAGGRLRRRAST